MSEHAEIVVAGGGIAGLSIAWELARRGRPPLVLRGPQPATSEVAAGMLAPMPEASANPRLLRLAVEALRAYPEILGDLAEAAPSDVGWLASGVLRLAYGEEEAAALREEVGSYEAAGMPSRWLAPAAVAAEVPGVGLEGLTGALLTYDEAQVQPAWMLEALETAIVAAGGRIRSAEVAAVWSREGGAAVDLAGGGAITAARVILALGSWTARLPGLDYLVRPVKGQLLVLRAASRPARILFSGHDYLVPKADGTLMLGGTMEEAGFSTAPDEGAERLRELLPRIWPAAAGAPGTALAGLRPAAPDGLPVVGPLPEIPAVHVFTAHFRNGFLLAPLCARLAAAEILGEPPHPLLAPLRPARLRKS
jgi:glycine oxidase